MRFDKLGIFEYLSAEVTLEPLAFVHIRNMTRVVCPGLEYTTMGTWLHVCAQMTILVIFELVPTHEGGLTVGTFKSWTVTVAMSPPNMGLERTGI